MPQGFSRGGTAGQLCPSGTGDSLSSMSWWDVTALATLTAPLLLLLPPILGNKGNFPAWHQQGVGLGKAGTLRDVPQLCRTELGPKATG